MEGGAVSMEPVDRSVTLADIAREAGTSPSTASRALSGRGYVSPAARERLVATAERLGYVPNASARTLKQKTSRVVGVVVSDLANQFYALREAGYQMLILGDNSESTEEIAAARTFLAMRAPGVIMTPVGREATALLTRQGVAVVEVDRQLADVACDAVVIDNEGGARQATAHLLDAGHRRIGLLVVETDWTSDAGRLRGYRGAYAAAGIPVDESLIVRIAVHADAEERIAALLDDHAPTAIFAANNLLAEQAWNVCRRRGLDLPGEISLVGFDDVPWMAMVEPGITVVAQPTVEMGLRAAGLLLARFEEPGRAPRVQQLEPTLVIRGSTAPLL
jgi:LacI family transcriptional regulator